MRRPSIEVNIEELVLHGFEHRHRHEVASAFQGELSRLLTESGLPATRVSSRSIDRLDLGTISPSAQSSQTVLGLQLAHTVYGGLR